MAETSIAKPLSGTEALEACLIELRKALSKDDRFSTHMAYNGFKASIEFKFYPQLSYIPPIEREVKVAEGDQSDIAESPTVDEKVEIPLRPPNKVREESGMAQPILVTDGQGRSHEEWRKVSSRPEQPSVRNLKNIVKGG